MYEISKFQSAKAPEVKQCLTIDEVLLIIKNGDEYLPIINTARFYGKGCEQYDTIKTNALPTFRFNFLFKDSASNKNIIDSTGLIYLDFDDCDCIPLSDYIFASWKSLSNTGYGILVKVDNLTLKNYSEVYDELSKMIGIKSDTGARKATQQTVLSYDSNLFHNPNSLIFNYTENKKVSSAPIFEKREECIVTDDTFLGRSNDTIRFNNIDDYFTGDHENELYKYFDEKIMICSPFIPNITIEGNRNSRMFYLLSQYALLNLNAGKPFLKAIAETINKRMFPSLSTSEVNSICESIIRKREDGTLKIFFNEERRLLFNPKFEMSTQEKMKIVNTVLGKMKCKLTKETIYVTLENWDFDRYGKISQKKVAELTNKSISTIKRHWKDFKSYVEYLSDNKKPEELIPIIEKKEIKNDGITIEKYISNLKRKYHAFDDNDESFLINQVKKHNIKNSLDGRFLEMHNFMTNTLKNREKNILI